MSKYIIRNCPAYSDYCEEIKSYECQDCTDCVMKQIVEKCKLQAQGIGMSGKNLAEKILELLDIQEVE